MTISENKIVSIIYQLRKNDAAGEIVEELTIENPLTFLYGSGNLLPKFEEHLVGLQKGDPFQFLLESHEAYGEMNENAIVDVPLDVFRVEGEIDNDLLRQGNTVPMLDNEGRRLNGIVKEIGEETVKMDFNHPMAGSVLFFKGEVASIRDASSEEMEHGHLHGSGSCQGCEKDDCHSKEGAHDHDCHCEDGDHDHHHHH